jgi:hypothetical protein
MELLDRYLHAVGFWLPKKQADDILAELSEDIHSEVAEEEEKLGRSLNDGEVESILKRRGRPTVVAGRYLPQRSLIGPTLFPIYRQVMKIALGGYLGVWFAVWLCVLVFDLSFDQPPVLAQRVTHAWATVWIAVFQIAAIIT